MIHVFSKLVYNGTNPHLRPGALLAIPQSAASMQVLEGLQTAPARKIMWTLINYGAYIGDDTAANRGTFGVENGVQEEFETVYKQPFDAKHGSTFYEDLLTVFQSLKIVGNSAEDSIGGGGKPVQPLAPPICM